MDIRHRERVNDWNLFEFSLDPLAFCCNTELSQLVHVTERCRTCTCTCKCNNMYMCSTCNNSINRLHLCSCRQARVVVAVVDQRDAGSGPTVRMEIPVLSTIPLPSAGTQQIGLHVQCT